MNPLVMTLLMVVAIGVFAWQMYPKMAVLPRLARRPVADMQKRNQIDHPAARSYKVLIYGFIQKRMFRRPLAGLAHLTIFAAFITTVLNSGLHLLQGFWANARVPLSGTPLAIYDLLIDFFWTCALGGILYWLTQRLIIRPWRFRTAGHQGKAILILGFIATLAVSDFFMQGGARAQAGLGWSAWLPTSSLVGLWLNGMPTPTIGAIMAVAFWAHVIVLLTFLNTLPSGKHFHVIFALPNIFLSRLEERGHIDPPNLETAEKFGTATIADITWKQALDTYSCTECGRCLEYCPTALTDKPLTHRGVNLALKEALWTHVPSVLGAKDAPALPELVGEGPGFALSPETVWACTTCGSCEVECPVFIDQVPRIIQLRQNLVLMRGEFPTELNRTFKGMEQHSNPWGMNADGRDAWANGLDIPRAADIASDGELPLVYWIGCAGSFDDRVKKITLAMVKLLKHAGIPFCILGKEEGCTGDPARRLGNEYLFQTLAQTNLETLKKYKVKRILTHCPHCLQTLKNDYKNLGGSDGEGQPLPYEVVHHTQLLAELVNNGKIKPQKAVDAHVAFHDSCYLTRYNDIEEAPRTVLRSIPSLKILEFDNNRSKGVCCGAGGGRFWMEEKIGKRINHARLEDGLTKNPDTIGSGCPFCLTMLSDGVKDKGLDDKIKNRDVAELLAESMSL